MDDAVKEQFREFVAARTSTLMRIAYLLTGNQQDAEDLLQTALTRTASRFGSIRHADPEAYVRRILYNEQVSWWRRRARRRESRADQVPQPPVADPGTEVELRIVVRNALRQLPPRQRAVLVLRYFEDLPEADVADVMNCSVGTVRSQTHKAIAKFRAVAPELDTTAIGFEVKR